MCPHRLTINSPSCHCNLMNGSLKQEPQEVTGKELELLQGSAGRPGWSIDRSHTSWCVCVCSAPRAKELKEIMCRVHACKHREAKERVHCGSGTFWHTAALKLKEVRESQCNVKSSPRSGQHHSTKGLIGMLQLWDCKKSWAIADPRAQPQAARCEGTSCCPRKSQTAQSSPSHSHSRHYALWSSCHLLSEARLLRLKFWSYDCGGDTVS